MRKKLLKAMSLLLVMMLFSTSISISGISADSQETNSQKKSTLL